jgi:hypothetical protein
MLMIIPIIVGLLACMPVPIGDPERSRIDPDLNGPWVMDDGSDSNLYLFQPYDKRTWLVVGAQIEEGSEAEIDDLDIKTAGDVFAALRTYSIGDDGITSATTIAFKAWLTKLIQGRQRYKGQGESLRGEPGIRRIRRHHDA